MKKRVNTDAARDIAALGTKQPAWRVRREVDRDKEAERLRQRCARAVEQARRGNADTAIQRLELDLKALRAAPVRERRDIALVEQTLVTCKELARSQRDLAEIKTDIKKMMPHVQGVPPLVDKSAEAIAAPLEMADDMRRRWPLTPEEDKCHRCLCSMTGKQTATKLGVSPATVSRMKRAIKEKLLAFGITERSIFVFRPSSGHKQHIQGEDENTGEAVREIEQPAEDWTKDKTSRLSVLRTYHAANAADKAHMRAYYPDIKAEHKAWLKRGGGEI